MEIGTVYLLHFSAPLGTLSNPRAQAQHYIGWARNPQLRLHEHLTGQGAKIVYAAACAGYAVQIVRTWDGDRAFERAIKNRKEGPKLCPICTPAGWHLRVPTCDEPLPPDPCLPMDGYEVWFSRTLNYRTPPPYDIPEDI